MVGQHREPDTWTPQTGFVPGVVTPWLWRAGGSLFDLNTLVTLPGGVLTSANDINDRGQILASGSLNGIRFDVLLTPVPEPASWALLVAGFGAVGAAVRRRRTALAA